MNKEHLYGWIFTYNPYLELYMATTREHSRELFNGDEGNVISSKDQKDLEQKIIDIEKVR